MRYYTRVVHTVSWGMRNRVKAQRRPAASVRQSVTIPAPLAVEVRRVAKRKHITMSRALVTLAEKGVEAEAAARENLSSAYQRFMSAGGVEQKDEAGKDLIRAIFGRTAIADDSVL
jgi:hypothetical protein